MRSQDSRIIQLKFSPEMPRKRKA